MVYAVEIILISALTTVGFMAVWAATSPGNWFWRTMAFLGAMSPLLLIPAYEPFIAFVIQGAVVAAGVQLARWRANWDSGEPFFKSRFSLKTILLAMVPAALLTAVAVRLLEAKLSFWPNVTLIGFVAGFSSLAALWIARGVWPRMWLRLPLALTIPPLFAFSITWKEWFISNLASFQFELDRAYWPYHRLIKAAYYGLIWAAVFWVVTLFTYAGMRLTAQVRKQGLRLKFMLPACMLTAIVILPAIATFCILVKIDPVPRTELPSPNGYDDFLGAVSTIPQRVTVYSNNFEPETDPLSSLRSAVAQIEPALERVQSGLSKDCWQPLDYTLADFSTERNSAVRRIAAGFRAKGMLAERESRDFAAAIGIYLELVEFGYLYGHGGTIVDFLTGSGAADSGCQCLARISRILTREQSLQIVTRLGKTETLIEPLDDILQRDRVYLQHYLGWLGHLDYEFEQSGLFESYDLEGTMELIYKRHQAYLRLLQAKYALRAWHADTGSWPPSFESLVPEYLPQTLIDPYSSEELPLRYEKIGNDYLLYSVGVNGLDEHGKHHEYDPDGIRKFDTGDLTIEDSLLGGR